MLDRRIPTLVALFMLIVGFLIILFGLTQFQSLTSKATPTSMPWNVTFSNLKESGVTVSWQTDDPVVGTILFEKEKKFFTDDRDKDGISRAYVSHHITVSKNPPVNDLMILLLSAQAKYGTINGSVQYSSAVPQADICEMKDVPGIPPSCFPFRVKTTPPLGVNLSAIGPKNGVVFEANQVTPLREGLVYFSFSNSTIQSTLIGPDGTWVMPLSTLRTHDLNAYYQVADGDSFSLVIRSGLTTITFSCNVKGDFSSYVFSPLVVGKSPQC